LAVAKKSTRTKSTAKKSTAKKSTARKRKSWIGTSSGGPAKKRAK
jgi:hypothetical protein